MRGDCQMHHLQRSWWRALPTNSTTLPAVVVTAVIICYGGGWSSVTDKLRDVMLVTRPAGAAQ
jgi:hypothetical protein